jgi:hypothetical protein
MIRISTTFACIAFVAAFSIAQAQTSTPSEPPAQKVPVIDGGLGPCSVLLTVLTPEGKPVYAADVKVHITYGFAGIRKLDLEAYTNADGKLKFTGLPSRVHEPPLTFQASKDQLTGIATFDPAANCEAKHDLLLSKQDSAQ